MASNYRSQQVAEILGVSVDTIRRWCDDGRLPTVRDANGRRLVSGPGLAAYLTENIDGFAVDGQSTQSARNRLVGIVTRVDREGLTAIIEIQAGPHRVVSLMTSEGADELNLEPGDIAIAVVKATNVVMEAPR